MTDALILASIVSAYSLPWLVLTSILENTIWKD